MLADGSAIVTFGRINGVATDQAAQAARSALALHALAPDRPMVSTPGPFTLDVPARNRPPVANPGGPYIGFTGLPLPMYGVGSSDPDGGQTLTYEIAEVR